MNEKEYMRQVWLSAQRDAELEVIKNTAVTDGTRKPMESMLDFVKRANKKQEIAMAKYTFATTQLRRIDETV